MFKKIVLYKSVQNNLEEPKMEDCRQILQMLNNAEFHKRVILRSEDCENIQIAWDSDCHSTCREIVNVNINKGWKRVSGYLFLHKYINNPSSDLMLLKHHSVVKDEHGNLLETMEPVYHIEKYIFICHSSGLQGWDLKVI